MIRSVFDSTNRFTHKSIGRKFYLVEHHDDEVAYYNDGEYVEFLTFQTKIQKSKISLDDSFGLNWLFDETPLHITSEKIITKHKVFIWFNRRGNYRRRANIGEDSTGISVPCEIQGADIICNYYKRNGKRIRSTPISKEVLLASQYKYKLEGPSLFWLVQKMIPSNDKIILISAMHTLRFSSWKNFEFTPELLDISNFAVFNLTSEWLVYVYNNASSIEVQVFHLGKEYLFGRAKQNVIELEPQFESKQLFIQKYTKLPDVHCLDSKRAIIQFYFLLATDKEDDYWIEKTWCFKIKMEKVFA